MCLAGVHARRHLDQLHQLRRQTEMHADNPVLAPAAGSDFGDRQRRGIRGEDRALRADLVQRLEQFLFDLEVLEHRLDHQIAIGQSRDIGGRSEAATSTASRSLALHLAAVDRLAEKSLGLPARALERLRASRSRPFRKPARAATMAMPAPMVPPAPHTPTVLIAASFAFRSSGRSVDGGSGWCPPRSGSSWRRASAARPGTPCSSRSRRASAPPRWPCASPGRMRAS